MVIKSLRRYSAARDQGCPDCRHHWLRHVIRLRAYERSGFRFASSEAQPHRATFELVEFPITLKVIDPSTILTTPHRPQVKSGIANWRTRSISQWESKLRIRISGSSFSWTTCRRVALSGNTLHLQVRRSATRAPDSLPAVSPHYPPARSLKQHVGGFTRCARRQWIEETRRPSSPCFAKGTPPAIVEGAHGQLCSMCVLPVNCDQGRT